MHLSGGKKLRRGKDRGGLVATDKAKYGRIWNEENPDSVRRSAITAKRKRHWITGKIDQLCYVCGHTKKSDEFLEKDRFAPYPWCLQCRKEDEEDTLFC